MRDKKYLVRFIFLAEVEADSQAGALANAGYCVGAIFHGVKALSVQVCREVIALPEVVAKAITEAPYADQVSAVPALEAADEDSGLPPITSVASDDDGLPF